MGDPVCVSVQAADPVLEAGATSALYGCPDVTVVAPGEPATVAVMVVDTMDHDAVAALRAIRAAEHRPQVVMVATQVTPQGVHQAVTAGACGLLRRREATPNRLSRAVLAAATGDCTMPPDMLSRLLADGSGAPGGEPGNAWAALGLDDRERAVLNLVADGHDTGEIATALSYSTRTVTAVVQDITRRFRLRNRAHAVAYALRTGLL